MQCVTVCCSVLQRITSWRTALQKAHHTHGGRIGGYDVPAEERGEEIKGSPEAQPMQLIRHVRRSLQFRVSPPAHVTLALCCRGWTALWLCCRGWRALLRKEGEKEREKERRLCVLVLVQRCVGVTHTATIHCNTLPHTATHCKTLQDTATHCKTPQHTATHCNTLQHTVKPCNTLHHTATHCNTLQHTATHCNTLQHTATHCKTLQHTATHYITRQLYKH